MSNISTQHYDPNLVRQVKEIILRHVQPQRIFLFGSRVTGDARLESDYDFAFDAAEADAAVLTAIRDDVERLNTLYRIDVANIASADARFANRVRDTGLVIFSASKALRSEDGLLYFSRALERFRIVVTERERWVREGNGDIVLDVAAKRFEFTYEMAWKALKRLLDYLGIDARAPRPIFKEAFAQGLIADEAVWLDMIEMRNLSSHVYDELEISRILDQLERYLAAFDALRAKISAALGGMDNTDASVQDS
jgi:nucleotidyltransferase substrate binding protein (TIGR01987 family)